MALKDTLVRLKREQEDAASFEADKANLKDEWLDAVDALVEDFRTWLQPFEGDGSLIFHDQEFPITEEMLGTYSARGATIEAGSARIELRPVARVIVGGLGRIDLTRQGYPSSSDRILILRFQDDATEAKIWRLRMPVEVEGPRSAGLNNRTRQFDFEYVPFEHGNVERAIDFLLNR